MPVEDWGEAWIKPVSSFDELKFRTRSRELLVALITFEFKYF